MSKKNPDVTDWPYWKDKRLFELNSAVQFTIENPEHDVYSVQKHLEILKRMPAGTFDRNTCPRWSAHENHRLKILYNEYGMDIPRYLKHFPSKSYNAVLTKVKRYRSSLLGD